MEILIFILMVQNGKRPAEMKQEGKAVLLSVFGVLVTVKLYWFIV